MASRRSIFVLTAVTVLVISIGCEAIQSSKFNASVAIKEALPLVGLASESASAVAWLLTILGRGRGRTGFTGAMVAAWSVSICFSSLPIRSIAAWDLTAFAACWSARLLSSACFSADVLFLAGRSGSPRRFVALDGRVLRGEAGFVILSRVRFLIRSNNRRGNGVG